MSQFARHGYHEQYAYGTTGYEQGKVYHACTKVRRGMQAGGCVFLEKQVKCRQGRTCQQEIFGDMEEISFSEADQRPVAKEHHEEDIDPLGECQQESDGEHGYRAGHDGRSHHGKTHPSGQ